MDAVGVLIVRIFKGVANGIPSYMPANMVERRSANSTAGWRYGWAGRRSSARSSPAGSSSTRRCGTAYTAAARCRASSRTRCGPASRARNDGGASRSSTAWPRSRRRPLGQVAAGTGRAAGHPIVTGPGPGTRRRTRMPDRSKNPRRQRMNEPEARQVPVPAAETQGCKTLRKPDNGF